MKMGLAHLGVGGGVNQELLEANPLTQNRIGVCMTVRAVTIELRSLLTNLMIRSEKIVFLLRHRN